MGRLLSSVTPDLKEVFAYDFAGNRVDPEKVPQRPVVESPGERATREARESAEDEAWLRANPGEPYPPRRPNRTWEEHSKLRAWRDALPKCVGNVLKALGRVHYDYDGRGNLIQKTEPNGLTWRYTYDARNRLREANRYLKTPSPETLPRAEKLADGGTRWHSGTAKADVAVSFDYDAFGRRVSKRVLCASGPAEMTFFTCDGDVLLMEERFEELPRVYGRERWSENHGFEMVREDPSDDYSLPVAQRMHTLDAGYQWLRASLYLHEPGTFVPLARLDERLVEPAFLATGTDGQFVQVPAKSRHATVFYQNDHLGTPQELLDESGKVVWLARYKAWGGRKPTPYGKTEAAETDNAIRFQGQYADEETGLHYNRHRYYDPQTGRFISKDPIGLVGGLNAYQYAPNPIQWVDPLGLTCCKCLYRGVSAKHPAIEDAKQGIVRPANPAAQMTPEAHAEGGGTGQSQYVSWTKNKDIALDHANKDGPGGVLLSVPVGPPGPADTWRWGWTHINQWGEPEMLQEGTRTGVAVSHKGCK